MKLSIIYFSKTGTTRKMAEYIAEGMKTHKGFDVGIFDINDIDYSFLAESKAVVFGTPTYYANTCWQIKKWFDESYGISLAGKIGAVYATCDYIQGGADTAILTIINHLMVKGMLVYSGGSSHGKPFIHLGAVALKGHDESSASMFRTFGERIAVKSNELFGK